MIDFSGNIFWRDEQQIAQRYFTEKNLQKTIGGNSQKNSSERTDVISLSKGNFLKSTNVTSEMSTAELQFVKDLDLSIVGDIQLIEKGKIAKELGIDDYQKMSEEFLVILAYHNWEENCADHLYGEFAFAIWDEAKAKLFCARDHLGIIPFYYKSTDTCFLFSSSIKGLIGSSLDVNSINIEYLCEYLADFIPSSSKTIFQDIQQLPQGHILEVHENDIRVKRYWNFENIKSDNYDKNPEKIYLSVSRILKKCTMSRIPADEKFGITMSGGLDSSVVTSYASKFLLPRSERIFTFSKLVDKGHWGDEGDDFQFIKELISSFKRLKPVFTTLEPLPNERYYNEFFEHSYTLPFSPYVTTGFGLNDEIRKAGVKKILCGTGGDEFISNMGSGVPLLLLKCLRIREFVKLIQKYSDTYQQSFLKQLISQSLFKEYPVLLSIVGFIKGRKSNASSLNGYIRSSYVSRYDLKDKYNHENILWEKSRTDPRLQMKYLLHNGYHQALLETSRAIDSMYSFTTRYPLLDRRLIETCLAIPFDEYFKDGWQRSLIRKSSRGIVPEKIRKRKGWSPFTNSFATMLRSNSSFAERVLGNPNNLAWEIIDQKKINKDYKALFHGKNKDDQSHQRIAVYISRCIVVASFLEWVENKQPE